MECLVIPALTDNYIFLLHDPVRREAVVVDPGEARPVLRAAAMLGSSLSSILVTHHHRDHIGGIAELRAAFPNVSIFASALDSERLVEGRIKSLRDGDDVLIGSARIEVLSVPGHTLGHIAFYFPGGILSSPETAEGYQTEERYHAEEHGDLFCGDTLFGGGCGRLFEGTPRQMRESLAKIEKLPDATRIWFAHEYTIRNLEFASTIEPNNYTITTRLAALRRHLQVEPYPIPQTPFTLTSATSVPSTLAEQKATNPFLRCHLPEVQQAVAARDSLTTFTRLRELRNKW